MRSSRSRYDDDDDDDDDEPAPAKSSNTLLWVLLFSGLGVVGLLACCGCGGVAYLIFRDDITGTTWRGNETLPGFGPLTFEFKKNGEAIMHDAKSTVKGTWVKNGADVTIRFANCEYRGTINGKQMTGSAHGAAQMRGQVWQFTVTRD